MSLCMSVSLIKAIELETLSRKKDLHFKTSFIQKVQTVLLNSQQQRAGATIFIIYTNHWLYHFGKIFPTDRWREKSIISIFYQQFFSHTNWPFVHHFSLGIFIPYFFYRSRISLYIFPVYYLPFEGDHAHTSISFCFSSLSIPCDEEFG